MAVRAPNQEDVTFANASRIAVMSLATWILVTVQSDSKHIAVLAQSLHSTIENQARIESQLNNKFSFIEGSLLSKRVERLALKIEAHRDKHPD